MRLSCPKLLSAALLVLLPGPLFSAPPKPLDAAPSGPAITLGDPAVSLTGPWKFSPGDSPWVWKSADSAAATPVWARPEYDDSAWAAIDLTPAFNSTGSYLESAGWVPGWTRRGYSNLSGFAWYRLKVRVANPGQQLWLKMPGSFEDAYEVYANGQYVGQFGQFTTADVTAFDPQPASFLLPPLPPDGHLELALRLEMSPSTPLQVSDAGGLHGPPILGTASAIQPLQEADRDALRRGYFGDFLAALLFLLAMPIALWALIANPREFAWLWLLLALAAQVTVSFLGIVSGLTTAISTASSGFWVDALLTPAGLLLWILFWRRWFQLDRPPWVPIAASAAAAVHLFFRIVAISPNLGLQLVDPPQLHWFNTFAVLAVTGQSILLILILVEGFGRREGEAAAATLPILMLIAANYTRYLPVWFNVPYVFHALGLGFSVTDVEQILMILVIAALAARRLLETSVSTGSVQRILDQEQEQVRELQERVLVPEDLHSPHFAVEAEYRPAKVVGGDFLVTAIGRDGSLCVVIGDVSGKGIGAALLVAVLVGAARTRAAQDFDPITMLQTLDERLSGRSGGHFATCLAIQLFPNGVLRLANAGHIPPYLNGCELDLEGSTPLGIAGRFGPTKKQFQLRQGDILTFMTDGVIEARNNAGERFGFDQARVLSQRPPADVVDEVEAHSQNNDLDDDITIVRISFIRSEPIGPSASLAARQPAHA